jgi:hypothetical protein
VKWKFAGFWAGRRSGPCSAVVTRGNDDAETGGEGILHFVWNVGLSAAVWLHRRG